MLARSVRPELILVTTACMGQALFLRRLFVYLLERIGRGQFHQPSRSFFPHRGVARLVVRERTCLMMVGARCVAVEPRLLGAWGWRVTSVVVK